MPRKSAAPQAAPEAQLRAFVAKCDPAQRKLFLALRAALRKRLPAANELAYDYSSGVVLAFTPTEHAIHGIFSLAARDGGVRLYFGQGKKLPDPKKMLKGSGGQVRYVPIESVKDLAQPDLAALMAAAVEKAPIPPPAKGRGKLFIRTGA